MGGQRNLPDGNRLPRVQMGGNRLPLLVSAVERIDLWAGAQLDVVVDLRHVSDCLGNAAFGAELFPVDRTSSQPSDRELRGGIARQGVAVQAGTFALPGDCVQSDDGIPVFA